MTNSNEHFSLREQLTDMQIKIERISEKLIELSVINSQTLDERKSSSIKIEKLENDFLTIRGGVNLLKGLITIFGSGLIAFCTWIVSSNFNTNQNLAVYKDKQERLTQDVSKLNDKVEYLENEITKHKNSD